MPATHPQPKRPTLGWDNFKGPAPAGLPALDDLPHRQWATSGRAALYLALKALRIGAGDTVLAPSYHCPTLVAPLRHADASVRFYGLDAQGLPALETVGNTAGVKAIVVAQLFGLPRSLAGVRAWCDARGIALIEDCAHSFFGQAGERALGAWGDVATGSLSKFFPLGEGGLLASGRALALPPLRPAGMKSQIKAWVDVLEPAVNHGRLPGINSLLGALFRLKNGPAPALALGSAPTEMPTEAQLMQECDLVRCEQAASALAQALVRTLPRARIVARRREHFALLHGLCSGRPGMRPLFTLPETAAPYVMPLWVDDPEPVYACLRQAGCAVFRWDRVWPGVPDFEGDHGRFWQRHVLQLLCHQDLRAEDLQRTADALR